MRDLFDLGPDRPCEPVCAGARTVGEVLRRRARATPGAAASFEKRKGEWLRYTWEDVYDQAKRAAAGLVARGLAVGDRVAILGATRVDWGRYDLGGQLAGLVTVGIYPKQTPEQVRYLLEHSESRVIFVEDEEELQTVLEAARGLETLDAIVPWSAALAEKHRGADPRVVSPAGYRDAEPLCESALDARLGGIDPGETAILIYTSGTTGPPKGAMITHRNLLATMDSLHDVFPFRANDLLLAFLPLAHATERCLSFYGRLSTGVAAAYASSMGTVLVEIREARPTVFGSVPRLFEKAYATIRAEVSRKPALARTLFAWAEEVGKERLSRLIAGRPVPAFLALRYALAERLVFHRIRAAFGGRVRACITGAAPISLEILELFWAAGLPIYEGYGMTEATVITHINRDGGGVRLGTVGRPIPPTEHRVAQDGEILLGGAFVFKGYFKNPEATAEALQGGWLHSGDIGSVDADGFLRITDRKKHLIITAGGKNVAPANIERAIKSQSPLISQVHAHGDRRAYVSALIAPSPIETLEWGAANGVLEAGEAATLGADLLANPTSRSEALNEAMRRVVADPRFRALFAEPVRQGNRNLARVERVRRYVLLDRDFSLEAGEMTPTMKMKRKTIESLHKATFDRVYDEPGFALDAEPGETAS